MKNDQKRFKISKKSKIVVILGIIVILLTSWWVYANFMPRPLGDKLEYLGKKDFGTNFIISDSKPYADYYYGTDLTKNELKVYFSNAQYKEVPSDLGGGGGGYSFDSLHFSSKKEEFIIRYYDNTNVIAEIPGLKNTSKKSIISLPSFVYEIAKDAL